MRRRALLPLTLLALLAAQAAAMAAAAGGMAVVTVTDVPADPPAGEEVAIGFIVKQHGETLVSWPVMTVIATEASSGEVVRVRARTEGPTGSYVADIAFPTAGQWTLTFEVPGLAMFGTAVLSVAEPLAAAPAAPVAQAGTAVTTDGAPAADPTPAVAALLVGIMVLVVAVVLRSRRPHDDVAVSART